MKEEIKVYVASPYTLGWMPTMIKIQMDVSNELMDLGFCPFVPLLAHFLEIYNPRTEEDWLRTDLAYLKVSDAVLRLRPKDKDGNEIPSAGADLECKTARENNIPVFESIEELVEYFKNE